MEKIKYSKEIVDDKIYFYLSTDGKRIPDIYLEVQVINGRARLSEFNTKTMSCNQYTITAKLNGTATTK